MRNSKDPTVEQLKELLSYDADAGTFRWKHRPRESFARDADAGRFANRYAGKEVGGLNQKGYAVIAIYGRVIPAHRIAWAMTTGVWPHGEIDHINQIRSDNRLCNLRHVDRTINAQNRTKALSNNKSGFLGVCERPNGKFHARIRVDGRLKHLGTFKTAEVAYAAYVNAKRIFHDGNTL